MALINFLMLSSTEIGCFNSAYLCNQIPKEYLSSFNIDCFSFYNQSLYISSRYDKKHPTALINMGDYYFYKNDIDQSNQILIEKAVDFYTQAYLNGEPEVKI
jgi:hypothetical protein